MEHELRLKKMKHHRADVAGDVLGYLLTKYYNDGHDFFFRSKHVVGIGYDIRVVGSVGCMHLCRSNLILKVNNSTPYLWRTKFDKFQ